MNSSSGSILIVDDSADSRLLLQAILGRIGWHTREAEDGDAAMHSVARDRPDLVLLDITMPGRDGFEILSELRQMEQPPPVIFLSGRSDVGARVRGLEGGAVDFIGKPFDPAEVVARVKTQLRLAELTRDLTRANTELLARQRRIEEELRAAGRIQRRLLPPAPPVFDDVVVAWEFRPSTQVGGDLFQIIDLDGRHLAVFVVDVAGHGLPAAMVTASVAEALSVDNGVLLDGNLPRAPSRVLEALDRSFPLERFDRHFTITYGLYDRVERQLRYCSAGHPSPLLLRRGEVHALREGGTIIGLGCGLPFEEGTIRIEAGDRLFLYSDGITEAFGAGGQCFGETRLTRVLRDSSNKPLDQLCRNTVAAVRTFGAENLPGDTDDLTFVGLEFTPR